jgi:VanZ family protein
VKINTLQKYWKSLVVTAVVLVLSFARFGPIEGMPEFRFTDKLIHVFMYLFYALVLMYDYRHDTLLQHHRRSFVAVCIGIPLLVGAITETLQPLLFAPREGDVLDFAANTAGVLLAWWLYTLFRKKRKTR